MQINHQRKPNTMKSTHYVTHLKTVLLIAPLSLYLIGPTIADARDRSVQSAGAASPRSLNYRAKRYLTVYSASDRTDDGGLLYYAHSSYDIYGADGKLVKRMENHISATDEIPQHVSLPVGSHLVDVRSEKDGYVRVPVTIKEGRQKTLDLDRG